MEPIWLRNYPPGVPADVSDDIKRFRSLVDIIDASCIAYADSTAYVSFGTSLSYAALDDYAQRFAGWLQSVGLNKGDRIALMMPNVLQYPVCLLGALRAGAVVVNTNPLYTADELERQLNDAGARIIVVAENFAGTLEKALPRTSVTTIVVTKLGDMLRPATRTAVNFVAKYIRKRVPRYRLPQAYALASILKRENANSYTPVELTPSDLALLQYTGGTTGVAKGAILTHGNLVANVCQAHAWVKDTLEPGKECIVTALPLYHIFAFTANCLTFLRLGSSNLLILDPRDIPSFIKTLRATRFTAITGVNTLFNALLNHPDFAKLDFSALKLALGGGMAVQETVAKRWKEVTGRTLTQAYGLTETSPAISINRLDAQSFTGSVGLPISSTLVSIRDNDGKELGIGEGGEICVHGPQVTPGYWNRPEETAAAFYPDAYFKTGDIGYVDEDGQLFILDRKKDVIIVSGFNVYPNEIEAVAMEHPGVREAAAVGISDVHSGEVVKLFVIRKDPSLDEATLLAFCREHLARYKVPRSVEFRDDLPRSNVGKILRRALQNQ